MLKKYLLLAVVLLVACSSAPEKSSESILDNGAGGARCMLMDAAPEEIDDRVNVYLAMARAAKYNSRVVADNMKQKIFADNPNLTPKDIIENVLNNPDGGSELYNGLRVLDYAILYAGAYLADSQQSADDLILQRAAQSLAVAAVKAQGNVWLANRKIREINGMIKDENKNLAEINLLYEKNGTLDEATQEYRTALDVILRKLKDNREILIGETLEYRKLIKDKREKIELDGRKFYELDTFDKSLELSIFEKAALAGRDELKAKKVNIKGLSYEAINRYLAYRYDEVERLKINGYKENSTPYAEAVEKYTSQQQYRTIPRRGTQFVFNIGDVATFRQDLDRVEEQSGQSVLLTYETKRNIWMDVLSFLPFILLMIFFIVMMRNASKGGAGGQGGTVPL